MVVPLVTPLHPATTVLSSIRDYTVKSALSKDPLLKVLVPPTALILSYTRLPNLNKILIRPDQEGLDISGGFKPGYFSMGCNCQVCSISNFGPTVTSPPLKGYSIVLPGHVSCNSGPALVYHLTCLSGRDSCKWAHYTGLASSTRGTKPMSEC